MSYCNNIRNFSQLQTITNLNIHTTFHFFCSEDKEDRTHDNCISRVFTEEEWKELLEVNYTRSSISGRLLTEEDEKVNPENNILFIDPVLGNFGRMCYYWERKDLLIEAVKRCKVSYRRKLILGSYIQQFYHEIHATQEYVNIIRDIYPYLEPDFSLRAYPLFNAILLMYKQVLSLEAENRALKVELLKKYTPIPDDICDEIGEFIV